MTMANLDGTGPRGKGPRTGRGLGKCPPNQEVEKRPMGRPNRRFRNK